MRESTVNFLLSPHLFISNPLGEGGGGLFERGDLFNLAKMMVSVLHKALEYKVEKLRYKKLKVMQPWTKKQIRPSRW